MSERGAPTPQRVWGRESEAALSLAPGEEMAMFEVTLYPESLATPEQRRAARELERRSFEVAREKGWFDFRRARADGFEPLHLDHLHYGNRAFYLDDALLDPERPENLLYFDTGGRKVLVGFMFMTRTPQERGPQIGGPLTLWHYHVWNSPECALEGVFPVGFTRQDGSCAEGVPTLRSPEMMHVWLIDHPDGPFATRMELGAAEFHALLRKRARKAVEQGWGRF